MEETKGKIILEITGRTLLTDFHQDTHLGSTKLSELLRPRYVIPRLESLAWDVSARCQVFAPVNPKQRASIQKGVCMRGQHPCELWETDFKIQPARKRYKYLLVFVETLSGG